MDPTERDSLMTPTEIATEARLRGLERIAVYTAIAFVIAFALMCTGCTGVVPVHVVDELGLPTAPGELPFEVEEACGLLGIECASAPKSYGAIKLTLVDDAQCDPEDSHLDGYTWDRVCQPKSCAELDPLVIAHEFGHVLELSHSDDPRNLMYYAPSDLELDLGQLEIVDAAAARMDGCRL